MLTFLLDLLPSGLMPRVGLGALALALTGAGAGWIGYRVGHAGVADVRAEWAEERERAHAEASQALALLASRFAAVEAEYAAEKQRKARVIERRVEVVRREIQQLPPRDCPVRDDARRLLVRTVCAFDRNATRPECLPGDLPGSANAAGSGGAGEGSLSVDLGPYPVR